MTEPLTKKNKKKDKRKKKATLAERADKYDLYQRSVQCPDVEVRFFDRIYRNVHRRAPQILREDFCGTAAVSCLWAASKADRHSYGVDLDPEPLAWGTEHNVAALDPAAQKRVHLLRGDVREVATPKADVIAAQNFSFFVFKQRQQVIDYFRITYDNLARNGIFVIDMFGGSDVLKEGQQDRRKLEGFKYIWDQARFDPITHECLFHIHFSFKDGSELPRAFSYEWRLWSIPEVREMLSEAGFAHSEVYWEGTDRDTGEGNGVYRRRTHAPSDPAWVSYVVGIK